MAHLTAHQRSEFNRRYEKRFPGGCHCYRGGLAGTCECLDLEEEVLADTLPSPTVADVEAAFLDGRLYIEVDAEKQLGHSAPSGKRWDDKGALVHVISRPAHGEIRGYIRIDGDLHVRYPASPEQWDELDEVVSKRLGMPVVAKAVR